MSGVINVLVGVASSVLAWLLVYSALSPRLKWNERLTKRDRGPSWPGRYRYGMGLTNCGLWRSAVAVNVHVRARMRYGSGDGVVSNFLVFEIPTDMPFIPRIAVRRKLPWRRGRGSFYVPVLRLNAIADADLARLPIADDLRNRIRAGDAELEDLLDAGIQLRYWAWGFDAQTGAIGTASSSWVTRRDQVAVIETARSSSPEPSQPTSSEAGIRRQGGSEEDSS